MKTTLRTLAAIIIFSLFITNISFAQEAHNFSLQQCIDYALQHQTNVKSVLIDEKISEAKNKEVAGLAWPQLSASGNLQDFLKLPTTLFPDFLSPAVYGILKKENLIDPNQPTPGGGLTPVQFGTKYNLTGSVNISQKLFDGSVLVALQARKTIEELAHKNVLNTERDTKVAVSKAYYNVLLTGRQTQLIEDNISRTQKLLHDTREIYKNGFAEKLDVDRLTVQLNNLESQLVQAQNLQSLGDQLLKFQMGMPIKDSVILTDTLSLEDVKQNLIADEHFDYNERIEYQLLKTQKKVNEFDLKRYRLAYLPTLTANGSYSVNAARQRFDFFDNDQPWFKTTVIGLTLDVPIFDGFQKKYRVDQAKLNVEKTQIQINALKESIDLEQEQARTTLHNYLISLESQEKNMQLAEEVYNTTVKKYEAGVGSNTEINNAEGDLQQAQLNYYNALYNAMISKIDYLKAYGKIQ